MAGANDQRDQTIDLDEPLLVERVRRGDREAFGKLVDRYSEQAFAVAYGFLQHAEDAEDLAQDAFLRALERIDRLDRGSPFGPWFYRLLVNAALNRRKYLARRRMEKIPEGTTGPGDPAADAERAVLRNCLASAVDALPDDLATVVILHDLEGFTHPEIARVLEIPEGTCRSHLSRARRMLREGLKELRHP
ncbi:MAG: RNA polymerase sigma factor [Gemmatimonadetes bacterium]|uniref:RNA polymerase sigma factor n=1 Tax=Candidatus Kutchimonas denitrificans TaxID=3056748 RepID=A0AAE4Z5V3_9BACT|nr:RNA polymerase sigma factor [Gemmatimonadota bacterium]NIR74138.1 RNA polymerase sigma factor [Candidatus Kutchimonas denitrificans]NIS01320.1 RNA polymerase sigma factor [Gemmatimonadota bacterium]NIT67051.1 RNA polymerase sigma factor [Gemmatimonadota bacterium]NIU51711.1 sigma-70 family RNA polymerase sigma factor [Gemmatimonadota bacterium]